MMPATKTVSRSATASTSTSMASCRYESISTGLPPETWTAPRHVAQQGVLAMDDLHGAAAQHVGGPDHHGIADGRRATRAASSTLRAVPLAGCFRPSLRQQLLEALAVLGQVDGVGRGAEDRDPGLLQGGGELQRRLAAELDDDAEQLAAALLDARDLDHVLGGQRLEIEPVGGVVVGRDRLGIAIDHDGLDAGLAQRIGGMDAAIVELDALADAVGAAAEDDHLAPVAGLGLAGAGQLGVAARSRNTCRAWPRRTRRRRCRCACRRGVCRAPRRCRRPRPP